MLRPGARVHENLFLTLCGLTLHGVFVFHPVHGDVRSCLGGASPRGGCGGSIPAGRLGEEVCHMAMYKMRITVYKDPAGKTMKGPTAVHFLGDLCSALGLFGVLGAILAGMEHYGAGAVAGGIVLGVAGFGLAVVLHNQAKRSAERKFTQAAARTDGQDAAEKP